MERDWIFKRSAIVWAIGWISWLEEDNFFSYFIALWTIAFIPLTIYSYFFYDYWWSEYQESTYYNSYNGSIKNQKNDSKTCQEPENPYWDWWWHDAWYKRAEENWWNCNWNSDSFNEWCDKYYEQEEIYEECINK